MEGGRGVVVVGSRGGKGRGCGRRRAVAVPRKVFVAGRGVVASGWYGDDYGIPAERVLEDRREGAERRISKYVWGGGDVYGIWK